MKPQHYRHIQFQFRMGCAVHLVLLWIVSAGPLLAGELELDPFFDEHMVLQQEDRRSSPRVEPPVIRGTSSNRDSLRIAVPDDKSHRFPRTARFAPKPLANGRFLWEAVLKSLPPGPHSIVLEQKPTRLPLPDVVVGEVWVLGVPPLKHVPVRPDVQRGLLNEAAGKVRVLNLAGSAKEFQSARWEALDAAWTDHPERLPSWALHFAGIYAKKSKDRVPMLGIIIVPPEFLQGVIPDDQAFGAFGNQNEINLAFDVPFDASNGVWEDYQSARGAFSLAVSRAKRRGEAFLEPPPEAIESLDDYRKRRIHRGNIPNLQLRIRGAIW